MLEKIDICTQEGEAKYNATDPQRRFVVERGLEFWGLLYTPHQTTANEEVNQYCEEHGVTRNW